MDNLPDEMDQQEKLGTLDTPATEVESPIEADVSAGGKLFWILLTSCPESSFFSPRQQLCREPTTR
jgi:hypothetical protein